MKAAMSDAAWDLGVSGRAQTGRSRRRPGRRRRGRRGRQGRRGSRRGGDKVEDGVAEDGRLDGGVEEEAEGVAEERGVWTALDGVETIGRMSLMGCVS